MLTMTTWSGSQIMLSTPTLANSLTSMISPIWRSSLRKLDSMEKHHREIAGEGDHRSPAGEYRERGNFGSPTIFLLGKRPYFGDDQLPLVRMVLDERGA
ncbi:MAG: hypothetical protein RIB03_07885 [Henriciella sp.]|uniref:hypothetical protein n=1 Tax=Henriciella sp. TaxID=1968823 RepID=UPI0032EF5F5F